LSLKIQVLAAGKPAWQGGTLVLIRRGKEYFGGENLLADLPEIAPVRKQFESNPAGELSAFVSGGKSARSVLLLSTAQVKYQPAAETLRILGSRAVGFARKAKATSVTFALENATAEEISQVLQGAQTSSYSYTKYKSVDNDKGPISVSIIAGAGNVKAVQALVKREEILSASVDLARDFVNEIPAELYPENLAEQARGAAKAAGLDVTIYDEKRLAKERFNGVLTVGKGSNRPPRLTVISYKPASKSGSGVHLALVGKAVTFDTGGHSLKPAKSMWEMKGDMAGGAAVIGAMTVIGRLKPGIRVTGIVPSALNAIGPNAVLPGDIIRSRSGKTVHVDNTDAEGRLLLMDGLHLAQEIGATHIIDVATLTGSIVRALGEAMSGLFSNDDDLAQIIAEAGTAVGEEYWRMPLVQQYRPMLDHPVADIDNVGKSVNAGAIVAALFLQEFVSDDVKWAHLDIAGCGLYTSAQRCYAPGATGFAVRTLTEVASRLAGSR
jgi:leucyl aminopeptidase